MALQTGIFSTLLRELKPVVDVAVVAAPNSLDLRQTELRSSLENPQTPLSYPAEWLLDIWNGGRTDAGTRVSEMTAFQASTFLACVDLVAGSIAALPCHVYQRTFNKSGRAIHSIAYDHDLYDLVHLEPNEEMSHFAFTKTIFAHVLAWGNGYVELQRDPSNRIIGLWPRNPYKTKPRRLAQAMHLAAVPWRPFPVNLQKGELVYETTDMLDGQNENEETNDANARVIPAADVLHMPGLSFDGRLGQSTVWMARQLIGLALATERFGAKYFANFAKPGGMLEIPMGVTAPEKENAKRSWMEAQGGENAHRIAVMPPGFKFTPMSHNASDAQVVPTREFLRNEVCAIFHVPPHMAGAIDRGSRTNTEQLAQEFVQYTLMPWLVLAKQEFKRKLFPSSGKGRTPVNPYYIDFDVHDMLRPDAASREKYYASGRQWGYLNSNDIRAYEKLNPIEDETGEQYWMPVNMTLTTTPINPNTQDGAGNGDPEPEEKKQIGDFKALFRDAIGRQLTRRETTVENVQQIFGPLLTTIRDGLFGALAHEWRVIGNPGDDSDKFIAGYIARLADRAAAWQPENADALADLESARALRALRLAAYRDVANLKAKQDQGEEPNA